MVYQSMSIPTRSSYPPLVSPGFQSLTERHRNFSSCSSIPRNSLPASLEVPQPAWEQAQLTRPSCDWGGPSGRSYLLTLLITCVKRSPRSLVGLRLKLCRSLLPLAVTVDHMQRIVVETTSVGFCSQPRTGLTADNADDDPVEMSEWLFTSCSPRSPDVKLGKSIADGSAHSQTSFRMMSVETMTASETNWINSPYRQTS